MTQESRHI